MNKETDDMLSQEQILKNIAENIHYFEVRTDADDPWGERDIMKLSIGCTLRFHNGHIVRLHTADVLTQPRQANAVHIHCRYSTDTIQFP